MTLGELQDFCEKNNILPETPLTMDRGIDLIDDVQSVIYNGMDLVFLSSAYREDVNI